MLNFFIRIVILALVILGLPFIIPGLEVTNLWGALTFALIAAVFNAVIAPIIIAASYPLTVLTVGIFALLVNSFTFWLASLCSYGVNISSFGGAFYGGVIVWLVSFMTNRWLTDRPSLHYS